MALKGEDPGARQYVKDGYPLSDVTARIIAAAKEVHRTLGPGFENTGDQAVGGLRGLESLKH